ncbi:SIR2-domain-containing protein [Rhizopus microsporus var. microsporus]|uniref:SIR2-domain-containing protein n=1 Tax=Rhizopus microsporus var. microsporus TaxID=86635 RepID=A0A1X0QWJ2_RHIZD|nr:SIR2-domain-containing protein [Rhizopus microsporus var. microsporus]
MDQDNNQPITPSDLSSDSSSINKRLVLEDEVQTETQDDRVIKKSKVSQDEESSMHFYDLEEYNEESDRDWVEGQEEEEEESDTDSIESLLAHPALFRDDDSLVDVDNIEEEEVQKAWTSFTDEEMEQLREEAREIGLMKFLEKHVLQTSTPVPKMLEVFGLYMHPRAALLASDIELLPILKSIITRFLRKRRRLDYVNVLDDVVDLLSKANNIMIVTGAGVSVSCGIPDFRSETGIYSRLQEYELDDPQQMFDIEYFRETPEIFYSFAKELYPANYEPSPSHLFVKLVEDKGKLLRNYTQNIDTLEHKADIKRVVNCHGSFATASCVTCGYKVDGKEIESYIIAQQVPPCPKCGVKEGTNEEEEGPRGVSIMKPDITFFGERLPSEFDNLLALDTQHVDLLIVMGSSLKVSPVSEIMQQIPHSVPQILINRTPITHMTFDIQLLGDCDIIVPEICRRLNWELKHHKLPGGSALSEESIKYSQENPCKFWRNGLYTFPGAVVDAKFLNSQRYLLFIFLLLY